MHALRAGREGARCASVFVRRPSLLEIPAICLEKNFTTKLPRARHWLEKNFTTKLSRTRTIHTTGRKESYGLSVLRNGDRPRRLPSLPA